MHVFAFFLGLAVASTPVPSPASAPLTPLKVIGHVRSTPFCTAVREQIGPAVASVLSNDALIGASEPAFTTLYQDDVLTRSEARTHFDVYRLERLIDPIVTNIRRLDVLLNGKPDPKLQAMRDALQSVVAQQKQSLNVISGFVATQQLGELQSSGIPDTWTSTVILGQAPASPQSSAGRLFAAGVHNRNPGSRDPSYDANNVGPTYNPFGPLVAQIEAQRAAAQTAESEAAKLISAALGECAP